MDAEIVWSVEADFAHPDLNATSPKEESVNKSLVFQPKPLADHFLVLLLLQFVESKAITVESQFNAEFAAATKNVFVDNACQKLVSQSELFAH